MSHAEAAAPVSQQLGSSRLQNQLSKGDLPANHLFDTVLPVRPAVVNRGSMERMKPNLVEDLLARGGGPSHGPLRQARPHSP